MKVLRYAARRQRPADFLGTFLGTPRVENRAGFSRNALIDLAPRPGLRTWDLRIDMASVVKRAREFCLLSIMRDERSPIGEATGSSVTTVDQTDMRALVGRKTVVRHGAASL